ncbi:hypothetical protein MHYP_G00217790 [Metynnis hypsauchen]
MEQATLLIEESDCSGKEKKQRIIESLKGPALEIVRALRFTNPEATPGEYLDALNRAFGSAESGEDLYFSFRLVQQKSGEKLSDFVRRLEPLLARVVQKGGIMAKDMDRVRVEQLLRGAVGADIMLLQLRIKERRNKPPNFLNLLSEIRAEEEYERSRHRVNPRVCQVNAQENVDSDSVAIQSLKAELKNLKEQMAGLTEQPRSRVEDAQPLLLPILHSDDKKDSEATALRKNVNRVKRKIQNLQARDTNAQVATTKPHTTIEEKQVSSKEGDYYCYRCGENGHIATKCTLPENEKKVIQKLIASLRKAKDNRNSIKSDQASKEHPCSVRRHAVNTLNIVPVPEGLIGPTTTVPLQINDQPCTALLDSGSQVTIIFEDWYNRHLSHVPIQQTSKTKLAQVLGVHCALDDESGSPGEEGVATENTVGLVRWLGPGNLVIPPLQSRHVQCQVDLHGLELKGAVLIEANDSVPLPQGLILQPVVAPVSAIDVNSFSVLLQNESLKEITLQEGKPIGEWKERLRKKICSRRQVFSLHEWEVGLAKGVEHHIRLSDPRPFRERSRRIAPADIEDVRRHLQDLLAAGIIKESRSPYASPIVITRKKNGHIRMCIDYRTLNSKTIPDQYTTPRIDDALDCLAGSRWFSVLDLRSGYYQIAMSDQDKEKTAFICPLGFYQFERMPQGVTGAPATFQRLMEKAVGDMNLLQVLVYLDDLIVFGATLEEHEERLLRVLDRLEDVGLKVSLDKCQFLQTQIRLKQSRDGPNQQI